MTETAATLRRLADTLSAAQRTQKRLEKRRILSEYLRELPDDALPLGVTYLCGRPFPRSDARTLSVGGSAFSTALLAARPGVTPDQLGESWLRHSDPGDVADEIWTGYEPTGAPFSVYDMSAAFEELSSTRGRLLKAPLLINAFQRLTAPEIRAFVKIMLQQPRVGVQERTVEEAVAEAFGSSLDEIRAANRHRADLGGVALDARKGTLEPGSFTYFVPVDPMLAHPAASPEEVVKRLGSPVWLEDKFDGVRCQLHCSDGTVRLYSRDRKEITGQFPDVTAAFQGFREVALDGELMVLENGLPQPFARLQQRLNRRSPTEELLRAHPVGLVAFDLLAIGANSLLDDPLSVRRSQLVTLTLPTGQLTAAVQEVDGAEAIEQAFEQARARGNEGLMCKDPASPYASGRRGYQWLKLKRVLDTLDVVIVGAEWGHGKRRDVLSDYTFAVRGPEPGTLLTIGKAYGGLTDAEIAAMTEHLKSITTKELGRFRLVRPEVVLEVEFNNIQLSPRHQSGYALRFPRIVRIRTDKSVEQINTLEDVAKMHQTLAEHPALHRNEKES